MKTIFIFLIVLIAFISCKKESFPTLEGQYTGIFGQSAPTITFRPSQVSLTLGKNTFTGTSEFPDYVAICSGSWKADNEKIRFSNGCIWSVNPDHIPILHGEFEYHLNGDTLIIYRQKDLIGESYDLIRQ